MSKQLTMALVGVGRIGVTHLRALLDNENVDLKAIVEPNEPVGRKYAEQYGLDYYKSVSELKDRPDITAVDICVPEEYHLSTAVAAAEAGKHIMIEKPIAKTYEEGIKMIEVCKEKGVRLMVAHTCRSMMPYRLLREQIGKGNAVGELCEVSIRRYGPRATMDYVKGRVTIGFYIAIHDLDAVMWITGHKITEVQAYKIDKLNAYGEDGFDLAFRFDNGASGTMNMSWFLPVGYPGSVCEIDFLGDKGMVRADPYSSPSTLYTDKAIPNGVAAGVLEGKMFGAFKDQLDHFAQCVIDGSEFRSSGEDVVYSVKVVEAILRSMESGKPETV